MKIMCSECGAEYEWEQHSSAVPTCPSGHSDYVDGVYSPRRRDRDGNLLACQLLRRTLPSVLPVIESPPIMTADPCLHLKTNIT